MRIKEELKKLVEESVLELLNTFPNKKALSSLLGHFKIEDCKGKFGDYSTNIAMQVFGFIGKVIKEEVGTFKSPINKELRVSKKPSDLAESIKEKILEKDNKKILKDISISREGFLNFFLKNNFLANQVREIIKENDSYGNNNDKREQKIQVEFVSANPTGPLHLGNARGGPLGDVIANVLAMSGARVEREFYINDIGSQTIHFGETLRYWQKKGTKDEIDFPKTGYPGVYLKSLAKKIANSDDVQKLAQDGIKEIMVEIKNTLEKMGIKYDQFIYESEIFTSGKTKKVIEELKKKGETKEQEGAVWFAGKNQKFLKDRECVLVRSDKNKTPTYYANDIAYHQDKFDRGFDTVIDVWGSNHYGHMPRLKEALESLGIESDRLKILLYQYVRLKHGAKIERMAKREGTYITADQVLKTVGKDAFRMMMLMQSPNTHLDFDLKLAKKESRENPVYYLQYVNARINGILHKISNQKSQIKNKISNQKFENKYEIALIKELIKFPDLIYEISQSFEVHHLPHYGIGLAKKFHQFYKNCSVIKAENEEMKQLRLALIEAIQIVLKNLLKILGVAAPDKM